MSKNISTNSNTNPNGQTNNEMIPPHILSKEEMSKQLMQALKPDAGQVHTNEEIQLMLNKKMSAQAEAYAPKLEETKE